MRLVIACGVIGFHAMPITGDYDGWGWGQHWYHYGTLTVAAFMAMSGFFVMKTWERDPHLVRYWVRRALRIMPGLLAVVLVSAFVLGPLVTTRSAGEYFSDSRTWSFVWHNLLLFPQQYDLPGVFADNPYPLAINGSLWCLPVEVLGYAMVTVVGVLGINRRRYLIFLVAVPFAALLVLRVTGVIALPDTMLLLLTNPLLQYMAIYAMGIATWLYRDRIPLSWWGVAAAVVIEFLVYPGPVADITRAVTVPYAILTIGTRLPSWLCLPNWLTVASFGVFLYGFPVEQTLAWLGADNPWQVIGAGVPIALLLGLASWHLVEKHGLRLRATLTDRRPDDRPDTRPDTAAAEPRTERIPAVLGSDPPTVELPVLRPATEISGISGRRPIA
ncbi:acyltransferase family protein [Actinophytocola sp.]|uniref:acyltransferase family protein n=1 Tax=Actinophytocola sp. TaxID=1872138 RepID=UPI003D6BD8A9